MNLINSKGKLQLKTGELLHFTIKHEGKMKGMASLSTSALKNPYCLSRSENNELICSSCYAEKYIEARKALENCLEKNSEILTSRILDKNEIPTLNYLYFRFEAFGDLINETQFINYYNIAKANKGVKFALWTKNPFIVANALKTLKINKNNRIKNLVIVLSSPKTNEQIIESPFWFVDKIFTVYDNKTIKEKGIEINCGARSCLSCHKCYDKRKDKIINEKLK